MLSDDETEVESECISAGLEVVASNWWELIRRSTAQVLLAVIVAPSMGRGLEAEVERWPW